MTTSRFDMRHGRQGGRIVPFDRPAPARSCAVCGGPLTNDAEEMHRACAFVTFGDRDSSTVHVERDLVTYDIDTVRFRPLRAGDELAIALFAVTRAWCGARAPTPGLYGIAEFADDRLCRRCATLWPGEQFRLFEHETP